jgi:uncharacterized LabA/DUF88 family protein
VFRLEQTDTMGDAHLTSLHAEPSATGRGAASQEAAPFRFSPKRRTARLYIDGYNLYFGALKGTPLRWLDPVAMSRHAFPSLEVVATKYFTARVVDEIGREGQARRQSLYWRALRSLPNLEIVEGKFRVRRVWARSATPPPELVEVIRAEEKGSDVNLATHLIMDAIEERADVFIVVSGDSDLVAPIAALTRRLNKAVAVINPQRLSGPNHRRCRGSRELKQAATYYRGGLTWAHLEKSQLPHLIKDDQGDFGPPPEWKSI